MCDFDRKQIALVTEIYVCWLAPYSTVVLQQTLNKKSLRHVEATDISFAIIIIGKKKRNSRYGKEFSSKRTRNQNKINRNNNDEMIQNNATGSNTAGTDASQYNLYRRNPFDPKH